MSNAAHPIQSARASQPVRRVTRFVRTSIRPVVVRLTRRLSVTFWPRRRRTISLVLAALLLPFVPGFAGATPTGAKVVAGAASIVHSSGTSMQINQASQNAIINWQSFSIGAGESVRFVQPNASAVALNRVIGSDPSRIFGSLSSNGQVFLVNNAGVYFAPGAKVDVGGLVATSMQISDANFMAGKYQFAAGAGAGAVANAGDLHGAYVVLGAPQVSNAGSIDAAGGAAVLAAGARVTLDIAGDRLVSLNVDAAAANAAVVNSGSLSADGGKVFMTANSANGLLDTVINTSGVVRAGSIGMRDGQIVIDGGSAGKVAVSGSLAASGAAAGSHGGTVSVLGERVQLLAGANIDVSGDAGGGKAMVGGDFHGAGGVRTASQTQVDKGAVINADALANGAGGSVAVWADQHTDFAGSISALGGARGGDGGFVETSGKQTLAFRGAVRTTAAHGKTGTLLLDPSDITISTSPTASASVAGGTFTGSAASSNIQDSDLTAALGASNVVIDTASGQAGSGNITVSASVTYNSANSLTLKADQDISVGAPIINSGSGAIALAGNGTISVGSLASNGGSIAVTGNAGGSSKAGSVTGGSIASAGGNVTIQSSGAVSTGAINAGAGTIAITGDANVSIDGALATTNAGASAIVVNAGASQMAGVGAGGDISISGSLAVGAGGRATLFTGTVAGSTGVDGAVGAGSGHFRYNSDATTGNYTTTLGSGVYAVYREQPTLTVSASAAPITYGASPTLVSTVSGANGDTGAQALSGVLTLADDNVLSSAGFLTAGTHALTASGGADLLGYNVQYAPGSLSVAQKTLTIGGLSATSRVYDGTLSATVNTGAATYAGLLAGDQVSVGASGVFADKNVGTGKSVTLTSTHSGVDAGNYAFTDQASATADITARALSISGITAANKTYDGTVAATVDASGASYAGLVAGDNIGLGVTGSFADKTAAAGKTVTLASTHGGPDAGNYIIADQASTTADIGQKTITISGITAANKTYDGTVAATVDASGASYAGLVAGDNISLGVTGAFADKNAGAGKAVILASTHGGPDAGNYAIVDQASATADIAQKALTISGITAANKTYDGTVAATVDTSGASYAGLVAGDNIGLGVTGTFADKNAGAVKLVTLASTHTGADASNYAFTDQASTTADITARALTISGITAANKTYDGTVAATVDASGASYAGLVAGDNIGLGVTGSFADKTAAAGKTVTLASTHGGPDAGNYIIADQASTTADIGQKTITISGITAANKTYDGTVAATVDASGASYAGLVAGDNISLGVTGAFADKNAGAGKAVILASTHGGPDAGNYAIVDQASATADIAQKALAISGITAASKTYDGNVAATVDTSGASYAGLVAGDNIGLGVIGTFADKNAAAGKVVTLASTHSGPDAGNYAIADQASTMADIGVKAITISGITAASKTYDGTVAATVDASGASYAGLVAGDNIGLGVTGAFADKNAGAGKAVTLASTHGGPDAANYVIIDQASTTADIGQKALTIGGITAAGKTYDGTVAATVDASGASYAGLVAGDNIGLGVTGAFADKNAGAGKAVILASTHGGPDAGNYAIADQASATADVAQKALTISGITAASKTYDGTVAATVDTSGASYAGLVAGDNIGLGVTGTFADKNAGAVKVVTLASTHTGADAGNYAFTDQASTTADIGQKALAISGITAANKTYDGTVAATVDLSAASYAGLVAGDDIGLGVTGAFADKTAAAGKTVTLASMHGGPDAGNYIISDQASTMANIDPKALTISGITAASRTYDGTVAATVDASGASYAGLVAGDDIGLAVTGVFANKTAAAGKTVSLTSTHGGPDAGNYIIADQASTTADIDKKALAISGITAANRIYDGTSAATADASAASFDGLVAGDNIGLGVTGTFANKNAAAGKTVTLASTHAGPDAGNYVIADQASTTADIGQKALAISGITAANKTYDGGRAATVDASAASYAGLVEGDNIGLGVTGTFVDKNAGAGKTVTLASTYGGPDAGNYAIADQASTTASIGQKALTISGLVVNTKTYDGALGATVNTSGATFGGLVAGDTVTIASSGTFADKNVGSSKAVTLANTYGGTDRDNYAITSQGSAGGEITRLGSVSWVGGASGNWSAPSNWAGGAIPDMANVAKVIIVAGQTVTFDSAVPALNGAVRVDAIDGAGTLSVTSGTLAVADALHIGGYTQSAGVLHATSLKVDHAFRQTGGDVAVTGAIDITSGGAALLGNISGASLVVGGTGSFAQAAGSALTVTGATRVASSDNAILGNAGNDFNSVVLANTNDVVLVDRNALSVSGSSGGALTASADTLTFGVTNVGDKLTANSATTVGQSGALTVARSSDIHALGAITLDNAGNSFGGAVGLSGGAAKVTALGTLTAHLATGAATLTATGALNLDGAVGGKLQTASAALTFGATGVSGDLASSASGTVGQSGALTVTGASTIEAVHQAVTLDHAGNDFAGPVTLRAGSARLTDKNALAGQFNVDGALGIKAGALSLGTSSVGATLDVSAAGDVAQGGTLTVGGAASIDAGTHAVTLAAVGATQVGTVTGGGAAGIDAADHFSGALGIKSGTLILGTSRVDGNLAVTAAGDVTQAGTLTVGGASSIDAGTHAVTLAAAGNDFGGAVGATGASVKLRDANTLTLGKVTAASADLAAPKGLLMASNGQVDAATITLSVTDAAGTIGAADAQFAVRPGATVTFGPSSKPVQAYFASELPPPQFLFQNPAAVQVYSAHVDLFYLNGHARDSGGFELVRSNVQSTFTPILQMEEKKADSYAEVIAQGLPLDLTEQVAYPHTGSLSIRAPGSQGGTLK